MCVPSELQQNEPIKVYVKVVVHFQQLILRDCIDPVGVKIDIHVHGL